MRRIVLVLVLVAVVGIAGFIVLRPKHGLPQVRGKSSSTAAKDSTGAASAKTARKVGRTAGTLKPTTDAERKAEVKRIRDAERQRKRDLRRQEADRRRRLRNAGARGGRRRVGRGGDYYVLKAVVSLGSDSYALIDGRRTAVGDVIMGRRIVAIMPDRIEVEAFGQQTVVRVGESLMPSSYAPDKRR